VQAEKTQQNSVHTDRTSRPLLVSTAVAPQGDPAVMPKASHTACAGG
jgi:hypothetical protein